MSDIKFKFKKGEQEIELELKGVDMKYVDLVLAQSLQLLNVKHSNEVADENLFKLYSQTEQAFKDFFNTVKNNETELHEHNVTQSKSLKLKHHEDLKSFSLDLENDDVPEFYKTGIKIKNGKKTYKCHYKCPCGSTGNHYIFPNTLKVNCFDCGSALKVEEADKEQGFPNRDSHGNYYIAMERIAW